MARAANQKLKCLYLWQFLLQNTDEEHPATIPQMIEYLARHDIPAERKSLYDDIEALRQCGLDVEYRKAQGGGYYVASREFQLPELKLLVDAVQSSKFLSLRKSNALIAKLEKLTFLSPRHREVMSPPHGGSGLRYLGAISGMGDDAAGSRLYFFYRLRQKGINFSI